MFTAKNQSAEKTTLQTTIDDLLEYMTDYTPTDAEYVAAANQLVKLYALKDHDIKSEAHRRVSADTLAIIGANLAGIVLIVGYERANVITSKALSLLTKLR